MNVYIIKPWLSITAFRVFSHYEKQFRFNLFCHLGTLLPEGSEYNYSPIKKAYL